jgi:hypothetical protein
MQVTVDELHPSWQGSRSTHVPWALHVCTALPTGLQRFEFGEQSPVHWPFPVQTAAHIFVATQRPALLQVSTIWLRPQRTSLGVQSPVQAPAIQMFVHAVLSCQRPSSPQKRGTRPSQSLLPGLHSPPQVPFVQMNAHCWPGSHVPLALQVSGVWLAPHCLALGGQEPPQLPLEQMLGQAVAETHLPF